MVDSPDRKDDHLLRIWSVQYSLIQGYRALFLSVNIFIMVSIINVILKQSVNIYILILVIFGACSGLYFCVLWNEVIERRGYNVHYLEARLMGFGSDCHGENIMHDLLLWQSKTSQYKSSVLVDFDNSLEEDKKIKITACPNRGVLSQVRRLFFALWCCIGLVTLIAAIFSFILDNT